MVRGRTLMARLGASTAPEPPTPIIEWPFNVVVKQRFLAWNSAEINISNW
jgi:hypothetical protein